MTELTLEQLRFARAIGATDSLIPRATDKKLDDIAFYRNITKSAYEFFSADISGWRKTKGVPYYKTQKINFTPLDEAVQEEPQADMVNNPRNKYMREIKPGVWVDVYDVIQAWKVTNSAQQHLIKKALQGGQRGHKDYETDMHDIIASATRAIELDCAAQELGK